MTCNMSWVIQGKCKPRESPWFDSITRSNIYKFVIEWMPILFTIIVSYLYSDLCAHLSVCVGTKNHSLVWGVQSPKLSFSPLDWFFTVLSVYSTLFMDCFKASLISFLVQNLIGIQHKAWCLEGSWEIFVGHENRRERTGLSRILSKPNLYFSRGKKQRNRFRLPWAEPYLSK